MEKISRSNEQSKKPLYDRLIQYGHRDGIIPFDVPGHKMGKGIHPQFIEDVGEKIFQIDINSSKEVDMLSNPTGVIKEAEELAAKAFGCGHAFFVVNGSTSGVQNMILSTVGPNDKILLPRNVHKSAINGLILSGATPVYMHPTIDRQLGISMGVPFEEVKRVIDENEDAKAILLVNPTYFGITSDLEKIIPYAHSKGLIVLIDESHGAHFAFHDEFPTPSMTLGADLSTISMHKTGGSLTQSSILLMNEGRVQKHHIRNTINLMQSSSASYLLMASLDIARQYMATRGEELFTRTLDLSDYARKEINKIKGFHCVGEEILNGDSVKEYDRSKLIIDVVGLGATGFEIYDLLKAEYNIQVELAETNVILAIVSPGDDKQSIDALISAFKTLSLQFEHADHRKNIKISLDTPEVVLSPREAYYHEKELVSAKDAAGRISGESLMIYPPGIPIVTPGERITPEIVDYYLFLVKEHTITIGSTDSSDDIKFEVLKMEGDTL